MELLKNCYHKIHIHFVTFLYAAIAFLVDYEKMFLSALGIVCFHELCHLMMAYYFHFKIEKVEILPFGAYLSIKDFYYRPILEEICVVLAGPCSHLFIDFFIKLLTKNSFQDYLFGINSFVFFFNLLPIYPMDGHRILCLILQTFIDLKEAMYLSLKISIFTFVVLSLCYCQINTMVIIVFLFFQQFSYYKFIPNYLRTFYSQLSLLYPRHKKMIHHRFIYRRGYHNYYLINTSLFDETQVVFQLLKNIKQK